MYPYRAYYSYPSINYPQSAWPGYHPYNYPSSIIQTPTAEQVYAAKRLQSLQLKRKIEHLSASKVETLDILYEQPEPKKMSLGQVGRRKLSINQEFNEVVEMFDLPMYDTNELDKQPKTKLYVTVPKVEAFTVDDMNVVDVPSDADTSKLHRVVLATNPAIQSMIISFGKSTAFAFNKLEHFQDKLNLNVTINHSHTRARSCLTGRGCIKLCQEVVCPDNIEQVKQVLAIVPSLVYSFEAVSEPNKTDF